MNILVLTPWFPDHPNDQYGNFILDSIESLYALGHRIHVLVTRPFVRHSCAAIKQEMFQRGFSLSCQQYFSIPRNYLRFISNQLYFLGCARKLREEIADKHINVVHAHTEIAGYFACVVAQEAGVPVVTTLHGINTDKRYLEGLGQPTFLRRALSRPERLVLVGETLLSFVKKYLQSMEHVQVIHNGFRVQGALPFKTRKIFSSPNNIQLISVSNLVEGKGIDINLAALSRPEIISHRNWHYHIVGDGPLRRTLKAQAHQLNIAERVTFHGQCNHDVVYHLLSTCDVFSLPSAPEAFGVAYLEAMACGLLAIGVVGQGPADFIKNGHNGLLISERNISVLAAYLLDIFKNPSRYIDMAELGREHVWQHCTWQVHAQAMTHVFQEAVELC